METQLQIVSFEQAKRLKALGYLNPEVIMYDEYGIKNGTKMSMKGNPNRYSGFYSAPTVALALKWLRDNKDFYVSVVWEGDYKFGIGLSLDFRTFKTFEEAESVALDVALTLLEK